ncbi:PREDICTED: 1,2-dihydroxy-3-keto-5-methylthiopentene dioxygenase-like [Priapulus caudatus]|uniref:Acireductone dioxygenase n=1 Tax=Priapulus caudatus TaxID=37621 RepID=A0ABM1DUP1_PRICU|nr:PREDICTED: 1,2-dihydroxy-3-keto-5-methylthiopentene dioxygenase-like [Priapulus caudatus]
MVRAWYMADVTEGKLGVIYFKFDTDCSKDQEKLEVLRKERGYSYEDHVTISKESFKEKFDSMTQMFFIEHLHEDDEIRYIRDGSGYFDVRDRGDKWVRIHMTKGDMIILPAGLYHRFTLDSQEYAKASRYFIGVPVWTPINRPADDHPARIAYLKTISA